MYDYQSTARAGPRNQRREKTMAIIDKIKAKAKADVKHIVLPEGD